MGTPLAAQTGDLAMYTDLFTSADTLAEQLGYVKEAHKAKLKGAEEFYLTVLKRLVNSYPSYRSSKDLDQANEIARIVIPPLGDARYAAASGTLWQTANGFDNAMVKQDALIALGKTGDRAYLPQVIRTLNDMNTLPQSEAMQRERGERIAYGAIVSLGNYTNAEEAEKSQIYEAVFFAANGWYSARVKQQARRTLEGILEDPSDTLTRIIKSSALAGLPETIHPFAVKRLALDASLASKASKDSKAAVCAAALEEGWKVNTSEPVLRVELGTLRKTALKGLETLGGDGAGGLTASLKYNGEVFSSDLWPNIKSEDRDTSEDLCAALRKSYQLGDMDEKKAAIQTMAVIGSKDTALILSDCLEEVHQRRITDGNTKDDEELARALISALGKTRRSSGKSVLTMVQTSSKWTPSIQSRAKDAIKEIEGGGR